MSPRHLGRCGRTRRARRQRQQSQRDVSQADKPIYVDLLKWMKKMSSQAQKHRPTSSLLRACDFKVTGRGLQAVKRIQPGDTIVSVPLFLLITPESVLASHIGPYILRYATHLTPQQLLTMFLVTELCRKSDSPWVDYISTLPENYSTPLYFSASEVKLLPIPLQQEARALRERFLQAKRCICRCIELHMPWLSVSFTEERIRWAWSTVDTRSVYLETSPHQHINLDPEESNVALAPFLDLLNHSDTAKIAARVNETTGCYEIVTDNSYKKWDQVFICYGAHDNSKLLVNYGFVLPHNINNVYTFTPDDILVCSPSLQHWQKKLEMLQEANLNRNLVCSSEGVSWSLTTAVQICLLPWRCLTNWKMLLQGIRPSVEAEQECHTILYKMVSDAFVKAMKQLEFVKTQKQKDMRNYNLILQLAQDDVDILESTLTTLDQT